LQLGICIAPLGAIDDSCHKKFLFSQDASEVVRKKNPLRLRLPALLQTEKKDINCLLEIKFPEKKVFLIVFSRKFMELMPKHSGNRTID
jgi:hypothetical protein